MEFITKYREDRFKPIVKYKEGDVLTKYFNPFVLNKRISRKQKKWVAKWVKICKRKLKQWQKDNIINIESRKEYFVNIYDKIHRLSSK